MASVNVIGNVIKAGAASPAIPRIARELRDASAEAARIVARARERAAELIEEAEKEKRAAFAESAEQGYAAGLEQWNEALAEAWKQRDGYLRRNEPELVKLALAVAAQVVGGTAKADPAMVLRTVRKALKASAGEGRLTLNVHPSEEAFVRERLSEIEGLEANRAVVVGLAAVEAGGCVVESEIGSVDARLSVQMAALEAVLVRRAHASRG